MTELTNSLSSLREGIDDIDQQLIALLGERFKLTEAVGQYKAANKLPSVAPDREARQFERIKALCDEHGVPSDVGQDVLRRIIDEVVNNHNRIKN